MLVMKSFNTAFSKNYDKLIKSKDEKEFLTEWTRIGSLVFKVIEDAKNAPPKKKKKTVTKPENKSGDGMIVTIHDGKGKETTLTGKKAERHAAEIQKEFYNKDMLSDPKTEVTIVGPNKERLTGDKAKQHLLDSISNEKDMKPLLSNSAAVLDLSRVTLRSTSPQSTVIPKAATSLSGGLSKKAFDEMPKGKQLEYIRAHPESTYAKQRKQAIKEKRKQQNEGKPGHRWSEHDRDVLSQIGHGAEGHRAMIFRKNLQRFNHKVHELDTSAKHEFFKKNEEHMKPVMTKYLETNKMPKSKENKAAFYKMLYKGYPKLHTLHTKMNGKLAAKTK